MVTVKPWLQKRYGYNKAMVTTTLWLQ